MAVLCLLLPWSFGFAEGGNEDNVGKLKQENQIKSAKLKESNLKKIQAEQALKELKAKEEESAANTGNESNNNSNAQSSGNGQGLPNEKSAEAEQYQLLAKHNQSSTAR